MCRHLRWIFKRTPRITKNTHNIFVPVTVGGGIKSLDDVQKVLRAGADKIAINTAAIENKNLILYALIRNNQLWNNQFSHKY